MELLQLIVPENLAGLSIDRFLSEMLSDFSRSMLTNFITQGHVLCDDKVITKSTKVKVGQTIIVNVPEPEPTVAYAQDIPIDVIYEDEHLLVVNKPKGMVVHPAAGNPDGTLVNALLHHCGDSLSGIGGEIRPGIVHRIDRDTSGLLVVAKNDKTHRGLSEQLAAHDVDRIYWAMVYGRFSKDEGFVESSIGRSKNDRKKMAVYHVDEPNMRYAYTGYKVLERFDKYTLVECRLKTGRTHQIRVHMAHIGHPLAGDAIYGPKACIESLNGQCLHAKTLGFTHPITGEKLVFNSALPETFINFKSKQRVLEEYL